MTIKFKTLCVALFVVLLALPAAAQKQYRILAVQHQDFKTYTQSYQGFVRGLEKLGYGDRVTIEHFNAQRDLKALDAKLREADARTDLDLIFTIGTRATEKAIELIKDTPIIFTDLSDLENIGIIKNWKSSNANFTGVETPQHIKLGIRLMFDLVDFNSLGMIYLKGSPSHEGTVKQLKELTDELGVKFICDGFSLRSPDKKIIPQAEVRENLAAALETVAPQVDVFFIQSSRTFSENFDIFREKLKKHNIPSAGDPVFITKGLVMGIGRDKQVFGAKCAEYAVKIFNGAKPSELPMDVGDKFTIEINTKAAMIVGYDPSIDILGAADKIHQEIDVE